MGIYNECLDVGLFMVTTFTFLVRVRAHVCVTGNFYSYVDLASTAAVVRTFWPLLTTLSVKLKVEGGTAVENELSGAECWAVGGVVRGVVGGWWALIRVEGLLAETDTVCTHPGRTVWFSPPALRWGSWPGLPWRAWSCSRYTHSDTCRREQQNQTDGLELCPETYRNALAVVSLCGICIFFNLVFLSGTGGERSANGKTQASLFIHIR